MSKIDENERFVYVGRKKCGCAVGIVTDLGDARTANAVAGFIKDGLAVNRVPWSTYRQIADEETFMACPHGQMALPLKASSSTSNRRIRGDWEGVHEQFG